MLPSSSHLGMTRVGRCGSNKGMSMTPERKTAMQQAATACISAWDALQKMIDELPNASPTKFALEMVDWQSAGELLDIVRDISQGKCDEG